jgi:hypothetical protein
MVIMMMMMRGGYQRLVLMVYLLVDKMGASTVDQ